MTKHNLTVSGGNTKENINVSADNIVNLAIRQRPDIPVKYPDGSWGGPSEAQFTLANPVALAKLNTNRQRRSQVLGYAAMARTGAFLEDRG